MSVIRICDCPLGCHDYDRPRHMGPGEFQVFGGLQICNECLESRDGCGYWYPRVLPELTPLDRQVQSIYDPVIRASLEAGRWLKDWDKYTENRVKHITFKRENKSNGV